MESLGDIIRRLATTRARPNGDSSIESASGSDDWSDSCDICRGRGWFTLDVPAGHPEFGRTITCQCQQERLEEQRSGRLLRYSNLGHLTRFTFETLEPEGRARDPDSRKRFQEALAEAARYAEDPTGWLVFTGPHGSGKTHVAAAIANRSIEAGRVVFFVHVPDLLDHLRASFAPTSDVSYTDLFERVRSTPLLILDGLGGHSATPWAEEKLQQILNHRFNARLPTVVTTASDTSELHPYVHSRLRNPDLSRIIELRAPQTDEAQHLGRIEPQMLARMTFETFDLRGNNPNARQRATVEGAHRAAENFAADPDGWLTLFGETGVGKTHLAIAIAVARIQRGHHVFFAFVPELLDYLRYTFTPESLITYDRVFDEVKNTPLLILDDLGQERSSPWADEKLYQIIVHRHNARLPTVITSPLDFTEHVGPISSRIRDPYVGQLVRIDAPDYRIRAKARLQRARGRKEAGGQYAV